MQKNPIILLFSSLVLTSCNNVVDSGSNDVSIEPIYQDDNEDLNLSNAIVLNADFSKVVNQALLKKIDMYNAGCINPVSNYDRDFSRIKDLNPAALRIDMSIGKMDNLQVVTDEYEIYDYDITTGKYNVDKDSLHYDWTGFDEIINHLKEYEILPYIAWGYIPFPLQNNGKWNDIDNNIINWKEVYEEISYQYVKHCLDSGIKVGYHEMYNEPDLEILKDWGTFDETFDGFLDRADFDLYNDIYEAGVLGTLRADPDATVGGPAFALGQFGFEDWIGFSKNVLSKKLPIDFYSFHTYLDGKTWFNNGKTNEIEKVVNGLSSNKHYIKTALHINEYSHLNEANGSKSGLGSPFNYYGGASDTLDALMEVVGRSSVQWVYWAQFMESTYNYDPYGLIAEDGRIKAAFNAIKIYQDMPVWRYAADFSTNNEGIKSLVSSDEDKIGILLWNSNPSLDKYGNAIPNNDKLVTINLNNAKFDSGVRRVYRIDKDHASSFDKTPSAELVAQNIKNVTNGENVWSGMIPAEGVVYITINKNNQKDFTAYDDRVEFANDIKTSYYYEDRFRGLLGSRERVADFDNNIHGSYAHFDRTNWTMYLGMGDCLGDVNGNYVGQAHANGSILCNNLPEKFKVELKTEGDIRMYNKNTTLGFRIDFYDESTQTYSKSVYFHDGLYRDNRNPLGQDERLIGLSEYPWGTEKTPDEVISFGGNVLDIDLTKYAPAGWNAKTGKAMLSFDMQNTGADTRAMFTLLK